MRGPKESGFRPAIGATFRTAAQSYGAQVIGLILSGMLDDGMAGLLGVKPRGARPWSRRPPRPPSRACPPARCATPTWMRSSRQRSCRRWAAFRAQDERASLGRRLAREARRLNGTFSERRFSQMTAQAERQRERLRQVLLKDEGG